MEKMKIAIVDDLEKDRIGLYKDVERYLKENEIDMVICTFESGEEFLATYCPGMFTIVILDIYMSNITGFEVAERIRAQGDGCKLLFATTSEEFAVQSYEVGAAYYLLKPINYEKLEKGLHVCLKEYGKEETPIQVTVNRHPLELPLSAIYFAESHRNVLEIHLKDRVIKTYMTFQNFVDLIGNDRRFLVCNKGCIVNMDHILQMEEFDFILKNHQRVQVRKRGNNQIKMEYLQYACGKMTDE